jgi:hypothetical protein
MITFAGPVLRSKAGVNAALGKDALSPASSLRVVIWGCDRKPDISKGLRGESGPCARLVFIFDSRAMLKIIANPKNSTAVSTEWRVLWLINPHLLNY